MQPSQSSVPNQVISTFAATATVIKTTTWSRKSADAARDLLRVVDDPPQLRNLRSNEINFSKEALASLEALLKVITEVHERVQEASNTYGEKDGKRESKTKHFFARFGKDSSTTTLLSGRTQVQNALASLPTKWEENKNDSKSFTNELKAAVPQNASNNGTAPVGDQLKDRDRSPVERSRWLRTALSTLNGIEAVSGTIPVVGSYVGAAAKVGAAIVSTLQTMDENTELSKDLQSSTSRLIGFLKRLDKNTVEHQKEETSSCVNSLIGELKSMQTQITELSSMSALKKSLNADENSETLKGYQETIRTTLEEIQIMASLNTKDIVTEIYNTEIRKEQRRLLDRLGDASYGAMGDSINDVVCLPGTRTRLLGHIDDWMRDDSTSERVLWIRGMAGRGKSTIASTVVHRWKYRAACAIFHFRRGQNIMDRRLICALARQLGTSGIPEVKESILSSIREDEDIAQARPQDQFQSLLVGSLGGLEDTSLPILLVVDALDECESTESAVNFVKLIDQNLSSLPANVKFLLTSRPEAPLIRALEPRPWHALDLDTVTDTERDIAEFLRVGLSKVRTEYDMEEAWPPPKAIKTLVQMSQGLFQWAQTVIKYIMDGSPQFRLQELLDSPSVCDGLDALYLQILSKAFKKASNSQSREDLFRRTLGTIVVATYPISLEIMAFILADHVLLRNRSSDYIINLLRQEILVNLNSLLYLPRSSAGFIRLVHTSVGDLLVDKNRCEEGAYWIDLVANHQWHTANCLQIMNRDLRMNICNLSDVSLGSADPAAQQILDKSLPGGVQYCCRVWWLHLVGCISRQGAWVPFLSDFIRFSQENILPWLEVMSLAGRITESKTAADTIASLLANSKTVTEPVLKTLWKDSHRFISTFFEPISFGPLHIYSSALPFCPQRTSLWELYGKYATTSGINVTPNTTWPANSWTRDTRSPIHSIAVSPDGKTLASGTNDGMIRFWNFDTGAPVGKPLNGEGGSVYSLVFSPRNGVLASGSSDCKVRVWDVEPGELVAKPLDGHTDGINCVAFSSDGRLLASGSVDGTARLWDSETWTLRGKVLEGHHAEVTFVRFLPNGLILASASEDNTVRLWNTLTGAPVGAPLEGHYLPISCLSFSSDGTVLASGSADGTIRLWPIGSRTTVNQRELFQAANEGVSSISFSLNENILAAGFTNGTIRLWNTDTGTIIGESFGGHDNAVSCIVFSSDGRLLASGSYDQTIRVAFTEELLTLHDTFSPKAQDASFKVSESSHDEHNVHSVAFSPDGQTLASSWEDKSVRLLDSKTGKAIGQSLEGASQIAKCLAWSPDGKIFASGSLYEIYIWSVETKALIREPLRGHKSWVNSLAFSPNGKILASGSFDSTIRLWNTQDDQFTGKVLEGHDDWVYCVAFSSDGKLLASGSKDGSIKLWDSEAGTCVGKGMKGGSAWVYGVAFSPNDATIVSRLAQTIQIWDVLTGDLMSEVLPNAVASSKTSGTETSSHQAEADSQSTEERPSIATWMEGYLKCGALPSSMPIPVWVHGQWIMTLSNRVLWVPHEYIRYAGQTGFGNNLISLSRDGVLAIASGDQILRFDMSRAL